MGFLDGVTVFGGFLPGGKPGGEGGGFLEGAGGFGGFGGPGGDCLGPGGGGGREGIGLRVATGGCPTGGGGLV